ncbi:MAG TPA: hypothetical protein DDY77_00985, partial [Clostridiales bacterium]|nr:hypothetical protein [Clostridiales bacterium]
MEEKVICKKPNGMTVLVVNILLYALAIIGIVTATTHLEAADGAAEGLYGALLIVCILYGIVGLFLFAGLKVVRPQEALVLTLFGKYYGSIKTDGFFWVNPFCQAVNPAAATKLKQSGDVSSKAAEAAGADIQTAAAFTFDKKISLKIMTLNNNRQKINDCLGNP